MSVGAIVATCGNDAALLTRPRAWESGTRYGEDMLRCGLSLPNGGEYGEPRFVLDLAERCGAAGSDGLSLEDYVSYQGDPHAPTCDVWRTLGANRGPHPSHHLGHLGHPRCRDAGHGTWPARPSRSTSFPTAGSCSAWA